MIYVDAPVWEAHGTLFAHVISDHSADELHAFAARAGLDPRSWDGDHYDVPLRRYDDVVAAGAQVVDARTLTRLLVASGLRFRKRRGERPLAARHDVVPGLDVPHRLDIVLSGQEAPDRTTVAAVSFVRDAAGAILLVHSVRRDAWEGPGGMRETGETTRAAAAREVLEETGLVVPGDALTPIGYQRLTLDEPAGRWPGTDNHIQVYAARLDVVAPPLCALVGETTEARWVTPEEARARCAEAMWWPLLDRYLAG